LHTLAAEPAFAAAEDRPLWVHSGAPSGVVTVVSDQITAALPLSQISMTVSLACIALLSSMSIPGNCTVGGSVMWKFRATSRTSSPVGSAPARVLSETLDLNWRCGPEKSERSLSWRDGVPLLRARLCVADQRLPAASSDQRRRRVLSDLLARFVPSME
jgi:hypothetical protein